MSDFRVTSGYKIYPHRGGWVNSGKQKLLHSCRLFGGYFIR
jgi:hypothetical protein